jgi:Flp pilus assembly secretin CpaC
MKTILFTVALGAALLPVAHSDTPGMKHPPVHKPAEKPVIGPILVPIHQSVRVSVPESIAGVSLGSPYVANVAVHDKHMMFITGRAYGVTSLHIVDDKGIVIADTTVQVVSDSTTRIKVNKAGADYTMSCMPSCVASPDIGDDADYVTTITEQAGILANEE